MAASRIPAAQIGDSVRLEFDALVYSPDAIKRTLLKMSRDVSGEIEIASQTMICTLFRKESAADSIDELAHAFRIELVDEDLRERVSAKTEAIRNVILAHAFSRTNLVDPAE